MSRSRLCCRGFSGKVTAKERRLRALDGSHASPHGGPGIDESALAGSDDEPCAVVYAPSSLMIRFNVGFRGVRGNSYQRRDDSVVVTACCQD